MRTSEIQALLAQTDLDGWLLYDAHGLNPIARQVVGLKRMVTRRWFVFIPREGEPEAVIHIMEQPAFADLRAHRHTYLSWQELDQALRRIVRGRRVAMEYSPDNAIPYVARVDAGTIEKVRALGVDIVSSADLVATMLACWSPAKIALHRRAADALIEIKDAAFRLITDQISAHRTLHEYDVVQFIREEFARRGMINDGEGPICAVDANAGDPHYEPGPQGSASIGPDQLVLLDLWAKHDTPDGVYADITWTGYTGRTIPARIDSVFQVVARSRDRGVEFLAKKMEGGSTVCGYEVDEAVRTVIVEAGYGDRFIHRTGHSLGANVHDVGPNIDNLETQDRRRLQDGVAFTIEPGIYLPEFGIRSEINVLIERGRPVVTTLPLQRAVTPLL
ncbi:MAG: M24 family metallopeptidase [Candidatus Zixiibacteriota bacterium]